MEIMAAQREAMNPLFSFLHGGPFFEYYQVLKLKAIVSGTSFSLSSLTLLAIHFQISSPTSESVQKAVVFIMQLQTLKFFQSPHILPLIQAAMDICKELHRQISCMPAGPQLLAHIPMTGPVILPPPYPQPGMPMYPPPPMSSPFPVPPQMQHQQMIQRHPHPVQPTQSKRTFKRVPIECNFSDL